MRRWVYSFSNSLDIIWRNDMFRYELGSSGAFSGFWMYRKSFTSEFSVLWSWPGTHFGLNFLLISENTKKVMEFLKDGKCVVASVNSDVNFQSRVQEVRAAVFNSTSVIMSPSWLFNPNHIHPSLSSSWVTQTQHPIRLVVSLLTAPTYDLAKFLVN